MPQFRFHPKFGGNSITSNPWNPSQFVVATGNNFGVVGSGIVYLIESGGAAANVAAAAPGAVDPSNAPLVCRGALATADTAFDAVVSEVVPNVVVVASGETIAVHSLEVAAANLAKGAGGAPVPPTPPLAVVRDNTAEVVSLAWNPVAHETVASASWDGSVHIYSAANAGALQPRSVITPHLKQIFDLSWSAKAPTLLATASGDGSAKVLDTRTSRPALSLDQAHGGRILLSCHWNYYEPAVLATGGSDNTAKIWDLRRPQTPLVPLQQGHQGPVRRVRFSPHSRTQLLSGGYDFRACAWDLARPRPFLTGRYDHHSEFIVGVEWSHSVPGVVSTVSWDGTAALWSLGRPVTPSKGPQAPLPMLQPPPKQPRAQQTVAALAGMGGARGALPPIPQSSSSAAAAARQ